jgi:hypothetical protein
MVYTIEHLGGAQMPWKECKPMDERIRFIGRLLESIGDVPPAEKEAEYYRQLEESAMVA